MKMKTSYRIEISLMKQIDGDYGRYVGFKYLEHKSKTVTQKKVAKHLFDVACDIAMIQKERTNA